MSEVERFTPVFQRGPDEASNMRPDPNGGFVSLAALQAVEAELEKEREASTLWSETAIGRAVDLKEATEQAERQLAELRKACAWIVLHYSPSAKKAGAIALGALLGHDLPFIDAGAEKAIA